jgi:hypothetical protein
MAGRTVATLFDGGSAAHQTHTLHLDARQLAPGTYALVAEGANYRERLLLTRTR